MWRYRLQNSPVIWNIEYRGYDEILILYHRRTAEVAEILRELYKSRPPDWIRDYIWIYRTDNHI